ncbi:HEAT repeat domain-containing protein [Gemmata sp. G18]|uniref:HEAT repeat domain-containing protein n=1 Tax=Gemmata palustris TaxID=2822762 RepID=A0ABS5BMN6_9BACT|nr:HEAT repeat domain-containing protein [Gemmata palustris]MBP3954560.1 HEAT repeat domain-containing protein [Gemmata palustris]
MASKKWLPLRDRFRALLSVMRAFVRVKDQLPEDGFDDAFSELDDLVYNFPDEIFTELNDELAAVGESDAESNTGPVAPLIPGVPFDRQIQGLRMQIERLGEAVDELSNNDEDEDEDESDESGGTGAPEEPKSAPKTLGEAGPGKSQTYRGDIRAAVGIGGSLAFVTVHPEGAPTALYWLDVDKLSLQQDALECGGAAIAADGNTVYVGGTDKRLYECGKKAPKLLAGPFGGDIAAIVPVAKKRIAVLNGKQIDIISDKDGAIKQTLELPDTGTCLSVDKSGYWLAAGTTKGIVAVFDGQDKDEFEPSESAKLHDGAVTVIQFEPEELRFFSAGADNKLLTTFARGSLEPEDKGRANMHEDVLTALVLVPGDRFVTGSRDATLKNWPRPGAIKPSTLKDVVGRVVALAVVTVYNQPHVAVACDDNSIRLIKLEADGKFPDDPVTAKVTGAADWVQNELSQRYDPKRREKALRVLAEWKDSASIDILGEQITRDPDNKIRELIADLLTKSDNPRVGKILERAIGHGDSKVREIAFRGLFRPLKPDLLPIDLALKTGHADVGVLAIKALEPLARADDQALTRLVDALDAANWDVRKTALSSLETVYDAKAPTANLTALGSKHGDIRATALIRAYERQLLDDPAVQSAIRRRLEDADAGVRKVAFLLSVLSKPELAGVLRASDTELNRQLNELEKAEKADKAAPQLATDAKGKLTPTDYDTLLQATASRALDTCLRGARGLAVLGDPRAFGLLLQLSREEDVSARVDVCRALAALDDERAVNRLRSMLFDREASVRDAAYTALVKIFDKTPLSVAESGLTAADEDVRRRGLETLIQTVKKKKPTAPGEPGWDLLVRALNDSTSGVRSEAFKAALNLKIDGGAANTLRFTLQSIHPAVRREALTEVTAQEKEEWAAPLLYEFFNDADPGLRKEAFEFATKKNKDLGVLETALASRFPDARKLAVEGLIKKHSKAAQQVLLRAIADPDRDVRLLAVNALVDDDAKGPLKEAMKSDRADIRVRAAAALAKHGDETTYLLLTELASAPEPQLKEHVSDWLDAAANALYGLGELGDPRALHLVTPLLDSPHARLRKAAAHALVWVAKADTMSALRSALQNSDPEVKYRAALGLAYLGDATVVPLIRSTEGNAVVTPGEQFTATVALGAAAGVQGTVYLDSPDEKLRDRALLATLLLELKDTDGQPEKCIECVSARGARFRLTGAQALESFADPVAFREFVIKEVNDRGEDTPWKVAPEVVDDLANLLAFAEPQLKAKTALLLSLFDIKEQAEWNAAWSVHSTRFASAIKAAKDAGAKAGVPVASKITPAQLRELAFGGYVGLVREQGASGGGQPIGKIRQTALSRIFAIASKDATYSRSAQPVLAQAMGDPNQPVRTQAFEHLQALGMDKAQLGAEALEAGFTDLGVKGLELLTDGTSAKKGEAVLERVMLARSDDLAIEAAKLLRDRQGKIPVAKKALDAVYEPMRLQAVEWLASEYEASTDAQKFLRTAVESRYRKVREKAAFELAGKKDAVAYDSLAKFLREAADYGSQNAITQALTGLGDKRAADAFLDRIENDPAGTAEVKMLLGAAAGFREPKTADRLFLLFDKLKDRQDELDSAILTVSGHDQYVADREDEHPNDRAGWMKDQHPRHDAILARLLDRAFTSGDPDYIVGTLLEPARWSLGHDVDAIFTTLCTSPNVQLRDAAIQAYGWRVRKRKAPPDPLLKAVKHKNPVTQFFAAEGLARGGRGDGMQVLLSGIEYLEDTSHRVRAVHALGELGDPRSVDKLLALATEDGNPLQEAATEAIGHLKKSPQADNVFRLLEKHAKGQTGISQRALVGLRYFDTPSGWDIVRAKVNAKGYGWLLSRIRSTAAEQLGYNDDPATRDLLLKLLRTNTDYELAMAAYRSARRLWGKDSLEPNYNLIQNPSASSFVGNTGEDGGALEPVVKRGDALRLMDVFPSCQPQIQGQLESALLTRPNLPVKEAVASLGHADEGTVRLATRLLGRVPTPDASVKDAVGGALTKWWKTWQDRRAKAGGAMPSSDDDDDDYYDDDDNDDDYGGTKPKGNPLLLAGEVVESLLFTAGRVGVQTETLAGVAKSRPDDPLARGIRLEAVRCLALGKVTPAVLDTLEALAVGPDADVRILSAELLGRFDAKRAAKLAEKMLSDRPGFNRLVVAKAVSAANVTSAAANVHLQPVALPVFVAEKDVNTLAAVAKDRKANEIARLGAVEGLGVMATETAEKVLVEIGTAKDDEKELRKAAWRALRRSKRARARGAANTLATMPKALKKAKPGADAKGGAAEDE